MATPHFDVEFTKDGDIFQQPQVDALLAGLGPVTDLLILSHGWNNDKADASQLYEELCGNIDKLIDLRNQVSVPAQLQDFVDRLRNRNFAAVRLFWPSKKFTDDDLIPGGGAASAAAEAENVAAVNRILDRLGDDPHLLGGADRNPAHVVLMERAQALLPQLATTDAKKEFVQLLRSILDPSMKENDDASEGFFAVEAETLFENAQTAVVAPGGGAGGGSSLGNGGAAGLSDLLSGVQAAARRIANFATYYQMKSRAGTVGGKGVADLLRRVRGTNPVIRIRLVGHSFGGRLVTAAAHTLPANTDLVTMSLLQAAFSHNGLSGGFGKNNNEQGFFRAIVDEKRMSGPIIITHTKNDKAVGIAYPLASRIAGQNAAALGDQKDPYGGMGRNGAQNTQEADNQFTLGLPGTRYSFEKGKIHNVSSDLIKDHNDVRRIEVAYAILSAAGSIA
jgi:pimeloyl-ACP methyl ester carboxylesterase